MKLPWRKQKKLLRVPQVPLTVLMREIVYDTMLADSESIANSMGLPPISPEVADMEEQASQDRLSNIAELLPFIDAHADIAAKIATSAYLLDSSETGNEPILSEQLLQLHQLFRMISLSAAVSCVSTLVNIGLVESMVENNE